LILAAILARVTAVMPRVHLGLGLGATSNRVVSIGLLAASCTLFAGLLIDSYFTLPRLSITEAGARFRAASYQEGMTFTRVLVARVALVRRTWLLIIFVIQSTPMLAVTNSGSPYALPIIFSIVTWSMMAVAALVIFAMLVTTLPGVGYAVSVPYAIGARVNARDLGISLAPGEERAILEAVDVGRTGVLWAPTPETAEAIPTRDEPIVIDFLDLMRRADGPWKTVA
jgi:hypothetical protein